MGAELSDNNSNTINYFGYGSLVNLNTLRTPYLAYKRATLHGYRRVWAPGQTNLFEDHSTQIALLSIQESAGDSIEGLVISDHAESLGELDEREKHYNRHIVSDKIEYPDDEHDNTPVFVYIHKPELDTAQECRILRSYLDAVAQGILSHYGEEALKKFATRTKNFGVIHDDRDNPIYPRSVELSPHERNIIQQYFG